MLGADTDMVTPPPPPKADRGGEAAIGDWLGVEEGKGCRKLTGEEGVVGDIPLALLSLRPRYWLIFSWKLVLMGWMFGGGILLKSSADLDQPRREMLRKSPRSEGGVAGNGEWGISREPGGRVLLKSTTDLLAPIE
jgi:hypothetical protein